MASQFSAEDQTDEDFFDKLVEEEFPVAQPKAVVPKSMMAREPSNSNLSLDSDVIDTASTGTEVTEPTIRLSNLSLDDKDPAFERSEISSLDDSSNKDATFEKLEVSNLSLHETEIDSSNKGANLDKLVPSSESLEKKGEELGLGLTNSPTEKSSTGSKGTSVKQVQWSVFGSGSQPFGSDPDLFSGDGLAEPNSSFVENTVIDQFGTQSVYANQGIGKAQDLNQSFYSNQGFGGTQDLSQSFYSKQIDTEFFNNPEPVQTGSVQTEPAQTEPAQVDSNEIANWENQYPGWKYDYATGNWYQVDILDPNSNIQSDNSNLNLEQSTHAVLETIAEESTGTVSTLTGTEYPSNMIFDPQYPGWYYDTNTQQWYALESYNPVMEQETGTGTVVQDLSAPSDGFITQTQNQNQNQAPLGQLLGSGYSGEWSSYANSQNPHPSQLSESFYGDNTNTALASSYYGDQTSVPSSSNQVSSSLTNSTMGGNFANNNFSKVFYGNNSSNQHSESFYGKTTSNQGFKSFEPAASNKFQATQSLGQFGQNNLSDSFYGNQNSVNFTPQNSDVGPTQGNLSNSFYGNENVVNFNQTNFQNANIGGNYSYNSNEGRSSAGRPPHALVTFGFGGKLVIMKDSSSSYSASFDYSNKVSASGNISILNLSEIMKEKTEDPNITDQYGVLSYFKALCQLSFPGPLVGGSNVASKDVIKWLDERISSCESSQVDFQKGEYLKLLLSLLKIFCQHYGKLRSPFGSDPSQQEADGPEMAVTKLFASAKRSNYGSFGQCMHNIPSESQIRATALEVQNLLVSGKRKEALHLAQEGQLWGPALVLAAQLGDQFYAETVKKMAHRQFVLGSPLRTLCLLIAGQPADVFSTDNPAQSALGTPKYAVANAPQPNMEFQGGGMLDEWEENLAIMAANRTNNDGLVMVHLGDCLWKEKGEVTAAHTCYLVAEANFESFSDTSRLCLVGADHWKGPRTFASPEAIQRTELFEYAKVLGNAQFMLLPFQPYKLVYAHMLAEMGKVSDSLKYCQASLKLLKSSRAPELEMLKQQFSSLEEQIRTHQQGGFSSNAPTKIVKNLFNTLDRSLQRVMGVPAPPQSSSGLPPMAPTGTSVGASIGTNTGTMNEYQSISRSGNSQSVSGAIHQMTGDSNNSGKKPMHNRSISEPDFARSPKQGGKMDAAKSNESGAGGSKLGRIGSTLFGWIAKPKNQAKLGEENQFYYDENLKRWVLKGEDAQAEAPPLAPPPTVASFQNSLSNNNTGMQNETTHSLVNGIPETKPSVSHNASETGPNAGMPPVPPSHNQFSNRGRVGVRSRYVDTFNKGGSGTIPTNQFHSPAAPTAIKPPANAKFFVPAVPVSNPDQTSSESSEIAQIPPVYNSPPPKQSSPSSSASNSSPPPPVQNYQNTPPSSFHRFPSMDNISKTPGTNPGSSGSKGNISRNRAASWSGSYNDSFAGQSAQMSPRNAHMQFMPNNYSNNSPSHDEFNEVEL